MTISSFNTGAYLAITEDQYEPEKGSTRGPVEIRPSHRQTASTQPKRPPSSPQSIRAETSNISGVPDDIADETGSKASITEANNTVETAKATASAICKAHYANLITFIKNRTNQDEDLAQEVAQETFVTLTRHLSAGRSITHARGLVFQIAKTKLIDHHRHSKARMQGAHSDIDDHQLISAMPDAESSLDTSRRLEVLEATVLELPERCREVFVLKIYEDLSYQEIASRRGISVSMVEKHVSKAFKIIRDKMGH